MYALLTKGFEDIRNALGNCCIPLAENLPNSSLTLDFAKRASIEEKTLILLRILLNVD